MKTRTITQVINSMRGRLTALGSPMASFSNYSNIYALFRTIAATLTEQDTRLASTVDSLFVSTAKGSDLERIASDYNLSRQVGTKAMGSVLVRGPGAIIPKGLILSIASQGTQFETLSTISTNNSVESAIPISSVAYSIQSNLDAGTSLYSALYPTHSFTVGRYRSYPSNNAVGSLSGGRALESDEELRIRIRNRLAGLDNVVGTIGATRARLLGEPYLSKVHIQEHFPVTGYFTVYIDSNDTESQQAITNLLNTIKPIGTNFLVKPIKVLPVRISMEISTLSTSSIEEVVSSAKSYAYQYVDSLDLGETLYLNQLGSYLLTNPLISKVLIKSPLIDTASSKDTSISIESIEVLVR